MAAWQPRRHIPIVALFGVLLLTLAGCGRGAPPPTVAVATPERGPVPTPLAATPTIAATSTVAAEPPTDFAFAFIETHCGESFAVDTFAGTFTVFVPEGFYNGGTRTIALTLTPDELYMVFRKMVDIGFFSYPAAIVPSNADRQGMTADYEFRARSTGWEQKVVWEPSRLPPTAKEDSLRELARVINTILSAHPETRAAKRGAGCT